MSWGQPGSPSTTASSSGGGLFWLMIPARVITGLVELVASESHVQEGLTRVSSTSVVRFA